MAYTNFCCRSGGSNLNAGTRTGNSTVPGTSATFTYASGNWVQSTGVFTVASGNPQTDGVAVGDFASVYADGSTVTGFVGRVTARTSTTITVSTTAKSGTAPTDGTGNRTLKIGGAWLGPNGAEQFPFNFVAPTMNDGTNFAVRVNMMNDATYSISSAINHNSGVAITFQGFSSAYDDRGRATIDGSTNTIVLLTATSNGTTLADLIVQNNGASGSNAGVVLAGSSCRALRCVANTVRGIGFSMTGGGCKCFECEAYSCVSNGFSLGNAGTLIADCIAHDNTGSGIIIGNSQVGGLFRCISETNGGSGLSYTTESSAVIDSCDFYNNTSHGIQTDGTNSGLYIKNCNFVKNGAYGVNGHAGSTPTHGQPLVINCGFGAGTQVNTSGQTTGTTLQAFSSVTYTNDVTPWVDPTTGDFRVTLAAAKGAGRGTFTQTQVSYTGAVAYPDIGAVQHQDSGGGSGGSYASC